MRKIYWLFICIFTFAYSACDKDDDVGNVAPTTPPPGSPPPVTYVDSIAPTIELFSPKEDGTYLAIGKVFLYIHAKDEKRLKEVRVYLVAPSGTRRQIEYIPSGLEEDAKNKVFITVIKPGNVASGVHTILAEAEDMNQNIIARRIRVNIIAEELSRLNFNTAFTSTGWYELVDSDEEGLDMLDFNYAFYSMINQYEWDYGIKSEYVNEFGKDFGGQGQLWAKWDENKDMYLSYQEFEAGFTALRFFETWDTDETDKISKAELARGVGALWDVNKDNVVTADEFEKKLLKYFLY